MISYPNLTKYLRTAGDTDASIMCNLDRAEPEDNSVEAQDEQKTNT